ncbi:ankyrin repeat domain-containing protein [Mycolicibacterium goodii]|uniref:ankyrin repeat domain-containing protein n=1 Tax=Mycolicibacterium goodii TaxID=134601 RepID=UPI0006736BB1
MARTPLHPSAAYNLLDDLRREIAEGYDINDADQMGFTPLHSALVHDSYDAAKILIDAGANPNLQDKWGNTPLKYVIGNNKKTVEIVILLLEHEADPTIENHYGHSPLSLAKESLGTEHLIPLLEAAAQKRAT